MKKSYNLLLGMLFLVSLMQSNISFGQDVTVTFDANGGEGTMTPQTLTGGSGTLNACGFDAPNPSAARNTLHTFYKWNTAADGTGTDYAAGQQVHFTSNITLYAQWYIFLDLDAGEITFKKSSSEDYVHYSGKVYVNGAATEISGRHVSKSKYYIYQSSKISGNYDKTKTGYASAADFTARKNIRVPEYAGVTHLGEAWAEFINNNSDGAAVIDSWATEAENVGRTKTPNRITIDHSVRIDQDNVISYNIVIDNVWCSYESIISHRVNGGLKIGGAQAENAANQTGNENQEKVTLKVKGDNRFYNIMYAQKENGTGFFKVTSIKGNNNNAGSLTVGASASTTTLLGGCTIFGSGDDDNTHPCYGLFFEGATVYVTSPMNKTLTGDAVSVLGGGTNNKGYVTINGGRLTAVANTTGAAIGGGGGFSSPGGDGYVTINGGEVYAYQSGVYKNNTTALPTTAIGGGSSYDKYGNSSGVTIKGGYVYAQSVGGAAIGGGGSKNDKGGNLTLTITGGEIHAKSIGGNIGQVSVTPSASIGGGPGTSGGDATVEITNGTLYAGSVGGGAKNTTSGKIGKADVTISGGDIQAQFIMQGTGSSSSKCTFTMSGGTLHNSNVNDADFAHLQTNGGALWINDQYGEATISGGSIYGCTAENGGAVYMNGGKFYLKGGTIGGSDIASANNAQSGAGIYMDNGTFYLQGGNVNYNKATSNGGGLYMNGGTFNFNQGMVEGNQAVDGAGAYMAGGTFTMENISGYTGDKKFISNVATGKGGAVYANGGTTTLSAGYIGESGKPNSALYGGGVYANGGSIDVSNGNILYNEANQNGGGVYANGGTVTFSNGDINNNSAMKDGGGLYISETGTLTLSGNAEISSNHVPATGRGGGVYLLGVLNASCSGSEKILVNDNYAGASYSIETRNNVYLNNAPITANGENLGMITLVSPSITSDSRIGFSVASGGYSPVVYSANTEYISNLMTNMESVFDDKEVFVAIQPTESPYNSNYICLYGCWANVVNSKPEEGYDDTDPNNVVISTPEGLAWLISTVSGLNLTDPETANPGINVTLANDIDMRAYLWVPIGSANTVENSIFGGDCTYEGHFNGNGHAISGLNCHNISNVRKYGLFGTLAGSAVIENVIVSGTMNSVTDVTNTYVMGGIAASMEGSAEIRNSISIANITTKNDNSVLGGIVGNMTSGSIKNSYANPKFNVNSVNPSVGGIVAVNTGGVVENCYVREQSGSSHGSNFSYLAYSNSTADNIRHSYAENTPLGTVKSDCGTFTATGSTPYKYKQKDNLVGETPLKQLLNAWVKTSNGEGDTYAHWNRPTTNLINGDYPLLTIAGNNAVAVAEGDASLHYGDVNDLMSAYTESTNAIWLYDSKTGMNSNATSSAALYIDEDAALTTANDATVINATVGITLDNSAGAHGANPTQGGTDAIDWHFFSSSLSNAPVGINYTDNTPVGIYETPNVYDFDGTGYFPATDVDGNSYYNEWDFYSYYEPQYQWVNFKRNSASHYNMDTDEHFVYENDTYLVPGKGYMLATEEETYLQCAGTLNNGTVSQTLSMSGPYRTGLNLLGNPYQSYLDFDEFAKDNSFIWGNKENASYIIMDEDQGDYVMYAYNASDNSFGAARYIHPHQGFMVYTKSTDKTATFNYTMRSATATSSFRGERINYPLVNLIAYDADGNRDLTTIELGRPDKGGALKANDLRTGTGCIYTHYEDEDYGIVFTQPGINSVAVRFETAEDASYTMKWDTENGSFSYLHLIDNITGIDVDCLSSDEYRFSSKTSDFRSRFKLVFDYTGIEEDSNSAAGLDETFAYMSNGQLVVEGEGTLQLIDINGRVLYQTRLNGDVNAVSLPEMAAGLYVLKLDGRTQKIVL